MNRMINKIHCGDNIELMQKLPDNSIDMVITSPPYHGLRNYSDKAIKVWGGDKNCEHDWINASTRHQEAPGKTSLVKQKGLEYTITTYKCSKCNSWKGQFGQEPTPTMFINHLVEICREVKRILKPSGSFYLNLGDSYAVGTEKLKNLSEKESNWLKSKQLLMIPTRVAQALQEDGFILRNSLVWWKPNPMPTPIKDRYNNTYEYIFFLTKEPRYFFDIDAVRIPYSIPDEIKSEVMDISYLAKKVKRKSYKGKNKDVKTGASSVLDNVATLRKVADEYIKEHDLGEKNNKLIKEYFHSVAGNPLGKTPGDVFEVTVQPFAEAHFAVFPPELVRRPIIASCPERVCMSCGTPWTYETITEVEHNRENKRTDAKVRPDGLERVPNDWEPKQVLGHEWKKNCDCDSEYAPGIVLDIFNGSGTTCEVAKKLRRRYIGFDINPEYCEMARERVGKSGKLESWIDNTGNYDAPVKGFESRKKGRRPGFDDIVGEEEFKDDDIWNID